MSRIICALLAFGLCCEGGTGQPADVKKQPTPLEARGTVVPGRRASVTSAFPGQVAEVLVEEGQAVKSGQMLIRLDRTGAAAGLRRAEAELELAAAGFKRVEAREGEELIARAAVTRAELAIQTVPGEQAQRAARADLDRARASLEALRKDVVAHRAAARAEIEVAKAKMDQARRAIDACEIRASIDGVVIGLNAELGVHTNPAMFGLANSATLAEIADLSVMKVLVEVKESDVPRVAVGQKCEIELLADPKAPHRVGRVERVAPVINRGSVAVRVSVEGKGAPALRIGTSAAVRFISPSSP